MPPVPPQMFPRISTIFPIGGERSNAADAQAVRRQTTVTRAPRSRARLISATNRRDSWRSHVHRTRFRRPRSSSSADLPMCGVEGQDPSSFLSGVQGGYSLSRKRVSPFYALPHGAGAPPPRSARHYNLFPYMKRSHLSMPLYNLRFLSAKRP